MTPRRTAMAALAVAALVTTGCAATPSGSGPAPSKDAAAIESDGVLTLYSGRSEDLIGPLVEQFTEETGIEVEARYGSTGEIAALLLEEGNATPAQVFLSQDAGALGALTAAGLASTLPAELAGAVPAGFTSTDDSWVGITGRARVIAYDGAQLTEDQVPDSADELVAPQWNGKVAFAPGNASFQSFVTGLRVLEGEDAADEWVAGMAANAPVLTESNGDSLELVNTGAAQLGLINHVVPDGQALARAKEIAARIARNGPLAVKAIVATLRETETMPEEAAFEIEQKHGMAVMVSEDAMEGPRAFFEKREPVFRGR